LSLCGGEPFLFKGILEVVAYAWEKRVRCNITTNGMSVHQLSGPDLDLLKHCKSEINISIDSFDDTIQAFTRGAKPALSNAVRSIQLLQRKGIPVTVLSAISKYNYHDLFDSLMKAHELGVSQVLYQPIISCSNYPDKQPIANKSQLNVETGDLNSLMDQLKKIHRFEQTHPVKTNVYRILPWVSHYIQGAAGLNGKPFYQQTLNKFYCREVDAVIEISYHGGIQPCGLAGTAIRLSDHPDADLLDLWAEATVDLKRNLALNRFPAICGSCCHKFSKNMYASIFKYPVQNRKMLLQVVPLLTSRILTSLYKTSYIRRK
jgi:MoaA/NifB/PqqE/SkfB family radical SAM enzyme